jgi:hypothetical protein
MKWQQKLGNSLGNNSSQTRCFDPKKRLPGRAKLLISEQQALGLSNLLNRCRGQNSYRGFESPPLRQFQKVCKFPNKTEESATEAGFATTLATVCGKCPLFFPDH